jgi:hypothetical protein
VLIELLVGVSHERKKLSACIASLFDTSIRTNDANAFGFLSKIAPSRLVSGGKTHAANILAAV